MGLSDLSRQPSHHSDGPFHYLGNAFITAARSGNLLCLKELITSPTFSHLPIESIEGAICHHDSSRHRLCLKAIIDSPRGKEISLGCISHYFNIATRNGHKHIAEILLTHSSRLQIRLYEDLVVPGNLLLKGHPFILTGLAISLITKKSD